MHGLERITIKDPNYKSEACIEIWQHEIHIRTAWSNYTYRIFTRGNAVWCEYIGAYRGLLEQKLLPSLTPKMNILDSEVVESSLTGNKRQTLRTYSSENLKLKNFRRDNFKEEYNADFVFVTHYPSKKRPFYAMDDPEDTRFTLSFDLLFHGLEITTGGQRIHDYNALLKKIEDRGMETEGMEQYLDTFKYGMPPHGGLGIGLERLTMQILGEENVRETCLFPRDMNRLEP